MMAAMKMKRLSHPSPPNINDLDGCAQRDSDLVWLPDYMGEHSMVSMVHPNETSEEILVPPLLGTGSSLFETIVKDCAQACGPTQRKAQGC